MKKLTTREKVLIGCSVLVIGLVYLKLKDDVFKVGAHYNAVTNKLCSGGVWKAVNISDKGFDLIRVVEQEVNK